MGQTAGAATAAVTLFPDGWQAAAGGAAQAAMSTAAGAAAAALDVDEKVWLSLTAYDGDASGGLGIRHSSSGSSSSTFTRDDGSTSQAIPLGILH